MGAEKVPCEYRKISRGFCDLVYFHNFFNLWLSGKLTTSNFGTSCIFELLYSNWKNHFSHLQKFGFCGFIKHFFRNFRIWPDLNGNAAADLQYFFKIIIASKWKRQDCSYYVYVFYERHSAIFWANVGQIRQKPESSKLLPSKHKCRLHSIQVSVFCMINASSRTFLKFGVFFAYDASLVPFEILVRSELVFIFSFFRYTSSKCDFWAIGWGIRMRILTFDTKRLSLNVAKFGAI